MEKKVLPYIIALSALSVSASAAFYSVFGLSHLFAGASTEVIVMAGALEVAKLVAASLLYQYWNVINKWLRTYLMLAVFILMVITSGGIYGFLSGAFEETNTQAQFLEKQVEIVDKKRTRFEDNKLILVSEKEQLNKSISDLRISLSNPHQVSYWDENSQTVITTTSSSTRRALQKELNTTIIERDTLTSQISALNDSIAIYDVKILEQQIGNESARELGPLKYMAELTGQPMENIVNWFMLLIIFVFDPLAIAMVIAANMAFAQIRKPKVERFECDIPEGLEYNKPYTKEEISEALEDDIIVTPEQEEKIKWENNLDDEGEVIKTEKYDLYGEKRIKAIEDWIKRSQVEDKHGRKIFRGDTDFESK